MSAPAAVGRRSHLKGIMKAKLKGVCAVGGDCGRRDRSLIRHSSIELDVERVDCFDTFFSIAFDAG